PPPPVPRGGRGGRVTPAAPPARRRRPPPVPWMWIGCQSRGTGEPLLVISQYQPENRLSYRGRMSAWSNLPPALPPHGTLLAWARGCRCDECEPEYKRFMSELALRGPVRLPARPDPPKLDADTLARLEPAGGPTAGPPGRPPHHQ